MPEFFKVVKEENGKFYSSHARGEMQLRYDIGIPITSGTPIFGFIWENTAKAYAVHHKTFRVLRGFTSEIPFEIDDITPCLLSPMVHCFSFERDDFWNMVHRLQPAGKGYTSHTLDTMFTIVTVPLYSYGVYLFTPTEVIYV